MADNPSHAAFIQRAYDDTYALLISMRDYLSGPSLADARMLEPEDRTRLARELSRITQLLGEVMAWLAVQKSLAAGDIAEAPSLRAHAARLELTLAGGAGELADLGRLPLAARSLIDRARRIAALVRQLDDSLAAR